jgi:undecaprenyl-diphosphatase
MDFDIAQAFLLGLVEGLTEFLPISSTGHLMLTSELLGLGHSEFLKSFEIAIQPGAILAVVVLYWRALLINRRVMLRLAVAFLPTVVVGVLVHRKVKELLGSVEVVLVSFFIGGIIIILFEQLHREREDASEGMENISFVQAFLIGLCQTLAFVPGVSRAAATILGGLAVNVRRRTAVEFSFLLAVPTMAAATTLDLYKFHQEERGLTVEQVQLLLVGFATSFVVAALTIQLILRYIKTHTFLPFGVYRIVAAVGFWLWLWLA